MSSTASAPGPLDRFWALSWKIKLVTILVLAIVLLLGGTALLNAFNFSVGRRTGIIAKLSTKGIACWTMEGQLAQPNFAQSGNISGPNNDRIDNTFYFSVPDPQVQKQVEAVPPGSPVTLEYQQKLFALKLPIPGFCLRRTEYEITGVQLAPAYPTNAAAPERP